MACRVGDHFVEVGKGKSKKLAKRQAAALMADRLRNIPSETSNVYDFDEDDDKICERLVSLAQKRNTSTSSKFEPDGTLLSKCQAVAHHKFSVLQVQFLTLVLKFVIITISPFFQIEYGISTRRPHKIFGRFGRPLI